MRKIGWAAAFAAFAALGCDPSAPPASTGETTPAVAIEQGSIQEVLKERDAFTRVRRLATLLPSLGPEGVPDARRALRAARAGISASEFELLVRYWATHEPAEAAHWALYEVKPSMRRGAIEPSVEVWAELDPTGAVASVTWAAQGADREVAQATQLALVRGWFQRDREALQEYIRGLGTSIERQRSLFGFALAMARQDSSQAVMDWAEAVPTDDPGYKRSVIQQVTAALGLFDPTSAERWCERQCDGPDGAGIRTTLTRLRLNGGEDPTDVIGWLLEAPEGESRTHALNVAWNHWASEDRKAAFAWYEASLAREPDAPWHKDLYGIYARYLAFDRPAEALEWAGRVEHPEARTELRVRIARKWLQEDPEAAEVWLEQSDLTEAARARARDTEKPTYMPDVSDVSDMPDPS